MDYIFCAGLANETYAIVYDRKGARLVAVCFQEASTGNITEVRLDTTDDMNAINTDIVNIEYFERLTEWLKANSLWEEPQ